MGSVSALKLLEVFRNVERVLGIELLLACQALEFRRPLRSSDSIERVVREVRKQIPFVRKDRVLSPLMMKAQQLISEGAIVSAAARHSPGLV